MLRAQKHRRKMTKTAINEALDVLREIEEIDLLIGALKLRKLLDQNKFPEWVVDSWIDDNKKRAVPLKNGSWIRTYLIMKSDENEEEAVWYTGKVVDEYGKVIGDIKTVNIFDTRTVDDAIWQSLEKFAKEYKMREEEIIFDRVAIDNEIRKLEKMKQSGITSVGKLQNKKEEYV